MEAIATRAALAAAGPVGKTLAQKLHLKPLPAGLAVMVDSVVGDAGLAVIIDNSGPTDRRVIAGGVAPRRALKLFEYRRRQAKLSLLEHRTFMDLCVYTLDGATLPGGHRSWLLVGEEEDHFDAQWALLHREGMVPWVAVEAFGFVFGKVTRSFSTSDLPPDYCRCKHERYVHTAAARRRLWRSGTFRECHECRCRRYRFDKRANDGGNPSRDRSIPTHGAAANVVEREKHLRGLRYSVTPQRGSGGWELLCEVWNAGTAALSNVVVEVVDEPVAGRQAVGVLHPAEPVEIRLGPFQSEPPVYLNDDPSFCVAMLCTDEAGTPWYRSGNFVKRNRRAAPSADRDPLMEKPL